MVWIFITHQIFIEVFLVLQLHLGIIESDLLSTWRLDKKDESVIFMANTEMESVYPVVDNGGILRKCSISM